MAEKDEKILIGNILKEERLNRGYTREQVAERTDIGTRYLIAIENDEKKPRFDILYRLVRSLGLSADRIFYPERTTAAQESDRICQLYQTLVPRDQKLVSAFIDDLLNVKDTEEK